MAREGGVEGGWYGGGRGGCGVGVGGRGGEIVRSEDKKAGREKRGRDGKRGEERGREGKRGAAATSVSNLRI